jgi:hypothetical protein
VRPVPTQRVQTALADCEEATLAALVADLRRARGGDPQVVSAADADASADADVDAADSWDGPVVIDGGRTLVPVTGQHAPDSVRADVLVTTGQLTAAPSGVQVVGPETLRRQLLYAVDRATGERLLAEYLDLPATVEGGPTPDATGGGRREAARPSVPGPLDGAGLLGVAVALAAILVVGAAAVGVGPGPVQADLSTIAGSSNSDAGDRPAASGVSADGSGSPPSSSDDSGPDPNGQTPDAAAEQSSGPEPTPDDGSPATARDASAFALEADLVPADAEAALGTSKGAVNTGAGRVGPPSISDPFTVPGVRPSGVSNPRLLARAHVRAAAERSYTLRTRAEGTAPPSLLGVSERVDQSPRLADPAWIRANGTLRASERSAYRQRVEGRIVAAGEAGSTLWIRFVAAADATQVSRYLIGADPVDGDLDVNRTSSVPLSPTVDRGPVVATPAGRAVLVYLTTTKSTAAPHGDGGARIVATGRAPLVAARHGGPERIRDYRATATIDGSGLVRNLTVRYRVTGPLGRPVSLSLRYDRVGTTTVDPPAWAYDRQGPSTDFRVIGSTVVFDDLASTNATEPRPTGTASANRTAVRPT